MLPMFELRKTECYIIKHKSRNFVMRMLQISVMQVRELLVIIAAAENYNVFSSRQKLSDMVITYKSYI